MKRIKRDELMRDLDCIVAWDYMFIQALKNDHEFVWCIHEQLVGMKKILLVQGYTHKTVEPIEELISVMFEMYIGSMPGKQDCFGNGIDKGG
jgi:hypothetical protein